ncbi:MAG: glycerate kinase [Cryobacterium sp.]|nr:glycerate kinase [Cryobacterium sp.]
MGLTVVVAPDSFKGSLGAREVAQALARGWLGVRPDDDLVAIPQADGGEGTLDAIAATLPDSRTNPWRDAGPVTGPDGRSTPGIWLELPRRVGVVELAQCSGISLMSALDPLAATTRGLGEVIRHTLEHGIESLVIALGGSASTDGGAGALSALGARLTDRSGKTLPRGGAPLMELADVDRTSLLAPPKGGVTLLADVATPLLGPRGAAVVFGPQKGATADDVALLDAALTRFATVFGGSPDAPGGGAAGGTAYGFATAWGAAIESGARAVQRLTGLSRAIRTADVVLTGEGHFDATSLDGKVVGELLRLARRHSVPTGLIVGDMDPGLNSEVNGVWTCALAALAGSKDHSLSDPDRYLEQAGHDAAVHFGMSR